MILIFSFLLPPAASLEITIGTPSPSSSTGNRAFTFNNINVTIKNIERIPIIDFNFTIFKGINEVDNVEFNINGSEKSGTDPQNRFTVSLISPSIISDEWYTHGYGYDINGGYRWNYTKDYGYGYGNESSSNVTLSYKIIYTSHASSTTTYKAKLFVNTTLADIVYVYDSDSTSSFKVTIQDTYTGGGGTFIPDIEPQENITLYETGQIDIINELFNISLEDAFNANDTDEDGVIDTFTDPNGELTLIEIINISGNICFLISVDDEIIPEFFWNPIEDEITTINHNIGIITDSEVYEDGDEVIITATIEKTDWTFIEIIDYYSTASNISIQTSDGRIIPSDYIWRNHNMIYILDDPSIEYFIIYPYVSKDIDINIKISLSSNSTQPIENLTAGIYIENNGKLGVINGTLTYSLINNSTVLWSETQNLLIYDEHIDLKTIYTNELTSGEYTFTAIYKYGEESIITSSEDFTIKPLDKPVEGVPLILFAIGLIIAIVIAIIIFLFKFGYIGYKIKDQEEKYEE